MALTLHQPAAAQSESDVRALTRQIERLQRELTDLQREVYRGDVPERAATPDIEAEVEPMAEPRDAAMTRGAAARLHTRLDQLEEQIQEVIGQLEETRYTAREVDERLDKLAADVDFRLQELEQGRSASRAAGGEFAGARPTGEDVQEPALDLSEGRDAADEEAADGQAVRGRPPRTLGEVSQEAVDALRRRQEERAATEEAQTAAAPADGYELPEGSPGEQYRHAFNLLRQADYERAEGALRAFVESHPDHELAGNAKYWLGETHYVRGHYDQAAVTFAEGFQDYPDGGKAPDNLLKLGMSLAQIDRTEDACGIYAELLDRYSNAASNILQRARREQASLGC